MPLRFSIIAGYEKGLGNVAIHRAQGADREASGASGGGTPRRTGSSTGGYQTQDRRIRTYGPGSRTVNCPARPATQEGAAAADLSGPEVRQHLERPRQTAEMDCGKEPRAFPDWSGAFLKMSGDCIE